MIVQRKSLNLHHVQGVEMFEDIVSTKKKKQKLEKLYLVCSKEEWL